MLSTEIPNRAPLQLQFLLQEVASAYIHVVDLYLLLALDQRNVLSKDDLPQYLPATCKVRWDSVLGATVLLHPEQSGSLRHLPFWKLLSAVFWVLLYRSPSLLLTYKWSSLGIFFLLDLNGSQLITSP